MTKPDFDTWSQLNFPELSKMDQYRISNYLEQAYNQGYSIGLNLGWAIEQDKHFVKNLKEEFPNGFA